MSNLKKFPCNVRCWECTEDCYFNVLIRVPEYFPEPSFNHLVMEKLHAIAGMLLVDGHTKEYVDDYVRVFSVSVSMARRKFLQDQQST